MDFFSMFGSPEAALDGAADFFGAGAGRFFLMSLPTGVTFAAVATAAPEVVAAGAADARVCFFFFLAVLFFLGNRPIILLNG